MKLTSKKVVAAADSLRFENFYYYENNTVAIESIKIMSKRTGNRANGLPL